MAGVTKAGLRDLAIDGGPPAFSEPLHVGRPNIGSRSAFATRLNGALDRRWLTNQGPLVQELELRLADLLRVRHCVAVANATLGLQLVVRALELSGEVILPSFTFVATAHALAWEGVEPIFCDVDPHTHTIDPVDARRRLSPRTSAILGVHLWGTPAPVEELSDLTESAGLHLFFDAAHAVACTHGARAIGGFGDAEVFSFHATKVFNTFEGGAITTNRDDIAAKLRLLRNFGFMGYDEVACLGINAKMSEPCAAMGLTNLDALDIFLDINRRNYVRYSREFRDIRGVRLYEFKARNRSNYQYVVVEIDSVTSGLTRDDLVQVLHAENVLARRYFYPGCHKVAPYTMATRMAAVALPNTEALCRSVMVLPTGTSVSEEAITSIAAIIRVAVDNAPGVLRCLGAAGS